MTQAQPLRFFDFPLEIRQLVYRQLLAPEVNRWKDEDSYIHYRYDLSLLRVNRRMHDEARDIFYRVNYFVAIETPWESAPAHISVEGFIPILLEGRQALNFKNHSLLVRIESPELAVMFPTNQPPYRFIIHELELETFCEVWNYRSLSTDDLNKRLQLYLHLSKARPLPGDTESRSLPAPLQERLIEPFGKVKDLGVVEVYGATDTKFEDTMREQMKILNPPPEDCLDEAVRLKELGNKFIEKRESTPADCQMAVDYYMKSFLALHIVCDGRRRTVWADQYYQREMMFGNHKGMVGGLVRLVLRVKLVANVVFAFLKMGNKHGYTWARFWGMRTINLLRDNVEDEAEEPLLDFPAANELGKIYYRTGVASKQLDKKDEARSLLKVAMAYLPNDPQVKQEHASVALKIA